VADSAFRWINSVAIVAVQVTAVHSAAAASSICSEAEECYVNGSSSKVCNRTEKKCNRCLSEKESDSILSTLGAWTEYNCYAYDDGECPSGTTECPASTWFVGMYIC
jgi:hypothetical protein